MSLSMDEQLSRVDIYVPWYADIVNFLACKVIPPNLVGF